MLVKGYFSSCDRAVWVHMTKKVRKHSGNLIIFQWQTGDSTLATCVLDLCYMGATQLKAVNQS